MITTLIKECNAKSTPRDPVNRSSLTAKNHMPHNQQGENLPDAIAYRHVPLISACRGVAALPPAWRLPVGWPAICFRDSLRNRRTSLSCLDHAAVPWQSSAFGQDPAHALNHCRRPCRTPLHSAATLNQASTVKLLVELKCSVDIKANSSATPLHMVSEVSP